MLDHLHDLYDPSRREYACPAGGAAELARWEGRARPALRRLLGLERMAEELAGHRVTADLGPEEDLGDYTRRRGVLHSEPHLDLPFWMLRPKGPGPFPLAVMPHGHSAWGLDQYVGIPSKGEDAAWIAAQDRDLAVQAVRRGFVALAPSTRGIGPPHMADHTRRHDSRACRTAMIHALLAGRVLMGERVWDLEHLIDWAIGRPEVDPRHVLMTGNSAGGTATVYAAACCPNITMAVPSCSFCTLVGRGGAVHHCDCNAVPGILRFGEFYDVAGLICPRPLLLIHGEADPLFPGEEVEFAVEQVRRIYAGAGAAERFEHYRGPEGHRPYAAGLWPFVEKWRRIA